MLINKIAQPWSFRDKIALDLLTPDSWDFLSESFEQSIISYCLKRFEEWGINPAECNSTFRLRGTVNETLPNPAFGNRMRKDVFDIFLVHAPLEKKPVVFGEQDRKEWVDSFASYLFKWVDLAEANGTEGKDFFDSQVPEQFREDGIVSSKIFRHNFS